jgi:toxin ParE1/3/4
VIRRIRGAVEQLAAMPGIGRPGRVPGTRELVVTGTPYIVPYRVRDDAVQIITVLHAAQKWPDRLP